MTPILELFIYNIRYNIADEKKDNRWQLENE